MSTINIPLADDLGFKSFVGESVCVVTSSVTLSCTFFTGLGGCGHHAGCVCQRAPGLQRQTSDQSLRLAQNTQDFIQEKQLLHQDQAGRGLSPAINTDVTFTALV